MSTNTRTALISLCVTALTTLLLLLVAACTKGDGSEETVEWEHVGGGVYRNRTPDGWLVAYNTYGLTFVPDVDNVWLAEPEVK